MNNQNLLRTLIVFAICVPLAIYVGYILTNPMTRWTFVMMGLLFMALSLPILLRWHHLLLVLSWNMTAVLFFLPGRAPLWLAMVALAAVLTVVQRIMKDVQPIHVPQLTWPLVLLIVVVIVTAKLTGGIGMRMLGGSTVGGKRYIMLIGAIVGYLVLTSRAIPRKQAALYVALFFLGGTTALIGDGAYFFPTGLHFLLWVFPPSMLQDTLEIGTTRFGGVWPFAASVIAYMMARYGIRGLFLEGRPWRLVICILAGLIGLLGGFRSFVIFTALVFAIQFFLEGLHRTKLLPILVLAGVSVGVLMIPLASKLPLTFQRAISFFPLLELDNAAMIDAEGSAEWRYRIWDVVWPEVPKYLLLGKGYSISTLDYQTAMGRDTAFRNPLTEDNPATIAGDYHNGPLSVLMPFGIWGAITFAWFLGSAFWVLRRNYLYGDPELRIVNAYLFATFLARLFFFFAVFGSIHSDILLFCGWLGMSVSLNHGVARPVPQPASTPAWVRRREAFMAGHRPAVGRPA